MEKLNDDTKKKLIIGFGILLIIILIVFSYFVRQGRNYNNIKLNKNNYLVYTLKSKKKKDIYTVNMPYVNIKGELGKKVNNDISTFLSKYMDKERTVVSYEYNISGDILSIILKVVDYETEFAPEVYFKSYNINLRKLELIDNGALFNLFGIDEDTISNILETQFNNYYNEILDEEYYDERECNYECFLKNREIDNYLDDVSYYVKDGNLIAYKPFIFYSIYGEENFFTDKHFEFILVKKES